MSTNVLLRAGAGIAVAGALAALAAGCGGSSSASGSAAATGSTSTSSSTNSNAAAFSKYQSCLQSHGVTFPGRGNGNGGPPQSGFQPGQGTPPSGAPPQGGNGQGGPPGGFGLSAAQRQKFQAAQQACSKLLPAGARNGGGFFGRGGGGGQNSQAFAAYRNCLKLNGVTLSQGFRPGGATPSAKVQKAMNACAALRPSFGRGGGGQPPPTTTTTG